MMTSKKNKVIGEFFEFRFHAIILGLDLTALNFWFFFFKKKEHKVTNRTGNKIFSKKLNNQNIFFRILRFYYVRNSKKITL